MGNKIIFLETIDDNCRVALYYGQKRKVFKGTCPICNTDFWVRKTKKIAETCSTKCRGIKNQKREKFSCVVCRKEFYRQSCKRKISKSGLFFCGRICKEKGQSIDDGIKEMHPSHYGVLDGKASYRTRAFRYYGKVCSKCGYDKDERMLDVDHIDSNRDHNKKENLQVLCVWCHALKTRKMDFHLNNGVIA